jgi:hypothetical protein
MFVMPFIKSHSGKKLSDFLSWMMYLLTLLLISLVSACSNQSASIENHFLANEDFDQCLAVPNQSGILICINTHHQVDIGVPITVSQYYLVSKHITFNELTNNVNSESSFGHLVFSPNGKYMYISYADEGHPYFIFYDTDKFINDDKDAELAQVSQYRVESIDEFYDNGDIVYSLNNCVESEQAPASENLETESCMFYNNITSNKSDQKNTMERAQKSFDALMACGRNIDVNTQNDIVVQCLKKLTSKTLQVRLLRKVARWTSIVKSYQPLMQCDDATLELYPRASSKEVELELLCFQFEGHKTQTGLVYYSKENEQLKINGIQF